MASPEAVMKIFETRLANMEAIISAIADKLDIDTGAIVAQLVEEKPPDRASLKAMIQPPTITEVPEFEGTEIEVEPPPVEPSPVEAVEEPPKPKRSSRKKSAAD